MTPYTLCFLFPGQGAYLEEVFTVLAARKGEVRSTFQEIDAALNEIGEPPVSPLLFVDSPPRLDHLAREHPDALQVALYGTAVALYRILRSEDVIPDVLTGHSLGEIAALVAGRAFTVADGAKIVSARSAALRTVAGVGGMLALRGEARRASALVDLLEVEGLTVAVENGPQQTVLSGRTESLHLAEVILRDAGIKSTRLASPYPFHSPVLLTVAEAFHHRMTTALSISRGPLEVPVYSPILGRIYTDDDDLLAALASHLTLPVRFEAALVDLYAHGARVFIESGARSALSGVARTVLPDAAALPTVVRGRPPYDSIQAVIDTVRNQTVPG